MLSKLFKTGAILLSLFLTTIFFYPHLVFKIPKYGFILHAIMGGNLPPSFSKEAWVDDSKWLRKDDVVISGSTKGGTTWALATVHALRSNADTSYKDIFLVVPFADQIDYPGQSLKERIERWNELQKTFSFHAFKSHFSPPVIKYRKDVKYVVPVRDFIDSAASFVSFVLNGTPDFYSATWGGFPPALTEEGVNEMLFVNMGNGISMIEEMIINHLKGWWPYRNEPNVLFLHYKDRLKNPKKDIQVLNEFLQTKRNEKELEDAMKASSFSFMKENENKFRICEWYKDAIEKGLLSKDWNQCQVKENAMVQKGSKRSGKDELPQKWREVLETMLTNKVNKKIIHWLTTGGPHPDVPFHPE